MKKQENNNVLDFKTYYQSLNEKDKIRLRDRVVEECGFSISTFYYKLTNSGFKKLEILQINLIIKNFKKE